MEHDPVASWVPLIRELGSRGVSEPALLVYVLALVELDVAGGERVYARIPRAVATVAQALGERLEDLVEKVVARALDESKASAVIDAAAGMVPVLGSLSGVVGVKRFNPPRPAHLVAMIREFARASGVPVPLGHSPGDAPSPGISDRDLRPPWLVFPEGPTSMRWRMGSGEDCMDRWLPFWFALDAEARAAYTERYEPPPEWRAWLERINEPPPVLPSRNYPS